MPQKHPWSHQLVHPHVIATLWLLASACGAVESGCEFIVGGLGLGSSKLPPDMLLGRAPDSTSLVYCNYFERFCENTEIVTYPCYHEVNTKVTCTPPDGKTEEETPAESMLCLGGAVPTTEWPNVVMAECALQKCAELGSRNFCPETGCAVCFDPGKWGMNGLDSAADVCALGCRQIPGGDAVAGGNFDCYWDYAVANVTDGDGRPLPNIVKNGCPDGIHARSPSVEGVSLALKSERMGAQARGPRHHFAARAGTHFNIRLHVDKPFPYDDEIREARSQVLQGTIIIAQNVMDLCPLFSPPCYHSIDELSLRMSSVVVRGVSGYGDQYFQDLRIQIAKPIWVPVVDGRFSIPAGTVFWLHGTHNSKPMSKLFVTPQDLNGTIDTTAGTISFAGSLSMSQQVSDGFLGFGKAYLNTSITFDLPGGRIDRNSDGADDYGLNVLVDQPQMVPGGVVTARWYAVPRPDPLDKIALYSLANGQRHAAHYPGGARQGVLSFIIPGDTPAGRYELRYFSQQTGTDIAFSSAFEVKAQGSCVTEPSGNQYCGVKVVADRATAVASSSLKVSWSGVKAPMQYDALTLFEITPSGPVQKQVGHHTGGTGTGQVSFILPADLKPGKYQIRLLSQHNRVVLGATGPIQIVAPGTCITVPVNDCGVKMTLDSPQATAGGRRLVSWSGITDPMEHDALVLAVPGAVDHMASGVHLRGRASGQEPFLVPADVAPGSYELRLLSKHHRVLLGRLPINVVAPPTCSAGLGSGQFCGVTLGLDRGTVARGGTATAHWQNIQNPTTNDFIGLYQAGAADRDWAYRKMTGGGAQGSTTMTIPSTLAPGTYEVRLITNWGTAGWGALVVGGRLQVN